jgi:hypothetical protein
MTNFARSSLALVLRAFFGGAKSCALDNIFMICPRWSAWRLADDDQILSLIAAISWLSKMDGGKASDATGRSRAFLPWCRVGSV